LKALSKWKRRRARTKSRKRLPWSAFVGVDDDGGDRAGPVFALELDGEPTAADLDLVVFFPEIRDLVLVEGVVGRQVLAVPEAVVALS